MAFNPGEILVFSRAGVRLGIIPLWATSVARSFRINEIEDWAFLVPQRDHAGANALTTSIAALLARDNIVYIENELSEMPAWAGAIEDVSYENGAAHVTCLSAVALLGALETTLIEQSGGLAVNIASRLVAAAAAKQGAHGDLTLTFVGTGTTPNYGTYSYEGDILQGLQQLAEDSFDEFYVKPTLSGDGLTLSLALHWGPTLSIDKTATTIKDGPLGNLVPGTKLQYSGLEVINRARLRGVPTDLGNYVDYDCIRNVLRNVTPEVEIILEGPTNFRRREDLNLTTHFGYSETVQRAMAAEIQQTYVDYYKSFLYAYHNRQGKPFLEGFDWGGPDSTNEKQITARFYRTLNKIGRIGEATVITADSDSEEILAKIDDWTLQYTILPVTTCVGVALDQGDLVTHYVADGSNGQVVRLDQDLTTVTLWQNVTGSGETLRSIATDPQNVSSIWVLVTSGTTAKVRAYDIDSGALLSSWTQTISNANDIFVDSVEGRIYIVANDGVGQVQIRDLSNGVLLSPDESFSSGFTNPVGISLSGGIAYVVSSSGNIRMLFSDNGNLAGTFDTGLSANGLFVDLRNRRIWMVLSNGAIAIYHAYIAVASVDDPGSVDGAPGFDSIVNGQFVHIVMTNDTAFNPPTTASVPASVTNYTVVSGDTLWAIAKRFYGSGSQWPTICKYNFALIKSTAQSHGFTSDFCHWIFPGEVLQIPGVGGTTTVTLPPAPITTKYLIVYTEGHWETEIETGPIGSPDLLKKTWIEAEEQIVGFSTADKVVIQDPAVVVYGEEGRVCDWEPTRDGYGRYKTSQRYRTRSGHYLNPGAGWYPIDWDVPDTEFYAQAPEWPEGEAYLTNLLTKRNQEISVVSLRIVNRDNIWTQVERGAVFSLDVTLQGPVPGGVTGNDLRVIAFSPNEATGEMEIVGEFV